MLYSDGDVMGAIGVRVVLATIAAIGATSVHGEWEQWSNLR